jgi:uncharacterized small protein (DUF1192 family)
LRRSLISQPGSGWQPPNAQAERPSRTPKPNTQAERRKRMAIEDDDKPRKKITHEIGQDLSLLSVEELTERIALMNAEIERLQQAAAKKRASKDAANNFFKS